MKRYSVFLLCFFSLPLRALIVGSDVAVSLNNFVTFLAIDPINEILAFGAMSSGFGLQNASTDCTFKSVFPVQDQLDLNGGTLTIDTDLVLENMETLPNMGNIHAATNEKRQIILPANLISMGTIGEGPFVLRDVEMRVSNNMELLCPLEFEGKCKIKGTSTVLDLTDDGSITVGPDSELIIQDLTIKNIKENNVGCADDTGCLTLDNTSMVLEDYFAFDFGAIKFAHSNQIMGNHVFAYQTQMTSTVLDHATLYLSQDITFSYDPIIHAQDLLEFIDVSSELVLNESTIYTTTVGLQLTKGRIIVEKDSNVVSEKAFMITGTGPEDDPLLIDEGVIFGDSSSVANDIKVQILPGVTFNVLGGTLVLRNISSTAVKMGSPISRIFVHTGAQLKFYESISLPFGLIFFGNNSILGSVPTANLAISIAPQGKLSRVTLTS